MPRFRLDLEYDGTDFQGWQVQASGARTVQGTLEEALARILGRPAPVTGAGRTDAGVHAEGQVAAVSLETPMEAAELVRALNGVLPEDLAVLRCRPVPDAFHPRKDAVGKHYRYRLWNGPVRSPLRRRRCHALQTALDAAAMDRAARGFEGTHDFASLQSTGSSVETTVRTLHRCRVEGRPGDELRVEVEGSGFLRHMVRTLAGTLIEVGLGKRDPGSIPALLAARDRSAAGPTAPACGLTLVAVRFSDDPAGRRPGVSDGKPGA